MNKKRLLLSLAVLTMTSNQYALAHGTGGGDRSFVFDKEESVVNREAEKQATEKKHDQDDWAEFMNEVNKPKEEKQDTGHPSSHDHH